jgi:hypothetical protein
VHRGVDPQIPQRKHEADSGGIVNKDPAARIDHADLCQKGDRQQADECHVPELDRTAQLRPEGKEIRQPVFAAKVVDQDENGCGKRAYLQVRSNVADLTVGNEVVSHSRQG